jgi:hypothetical protein
MHQWFISYNGQQMGPLDHAAAVAQATKNPNGHVWRQGFAEWIPLSACTELSAGSGTSAQWRAAAAHLAPRRRDRLQDLRRGHAVRRDRTRPGRERRRRSRIDDVQGSHGADGNRVRRRFRQSGQGGGFMDKLLGAGKRLITGESLFTTVFSHAGSSGKAKVAFAAPYPGTIVPMKLDELRRPHHLPEGQLPLRGARRASASSSRRR